jgi:CMP-N-acetylneuraminic acid synthetase
VYVATKGLTIANGGMYITTKGLTVANDGLFAGEINCFFVVYGERVDIDKLVVEYE